MADTLTRSHGAEGLRLLDGTVPGWFEQHGITSQPAAEPSPARKTISRISAPVGLIQVSYRRGLPSQSSRDDQRGEEATPNQACHVHLNFR